MIDNTTNDFIKTEAVRDETSGQQTEKTTALDMLLNEFIAIAAYYEAHDDLSAVIEIDKDAVYVRRKHLEFLLDKNKYETSTNKLLLWRSLKWIDGNVEKNKNRLTKVIKDPQSKKAIRAVKINLGVAKTLKKLQKTGGN